jgi:enoyl-CoA hydratase/carnithine racemase
MFFTTLAVSRYNDVTFRYIETAQSGHVFYITLNRPEKRNAFTPTMVNELAYAMEYANAQKNIWCVVIAANGPVFCAGMDLTVFQDPSTDAVNPTLPEPIKPVSLGDAFRMLNKPTIARIEGNVYAGGFIIAGGCMFVVAADEVEFSLPEVKRGIFPMQVVSTLLNFMLPRQAMQLCVLGESFSARAAQKLGMVSHVCCQADMDEKLGSLIDALLNNSPYAISKGIAAFRALSDIPHYAKFGFLAEQLTRIRQSNDAQEGIAAFKEKRKPEWTNC